MIRRLACLSLLLLMAVPAANAALRASVDNPQVAQGDTIELTLTHDGQSGTDPDLAPLKHVKCINLFYLRCTQLSEIKHKTLFVARPTRFSRHSKMTI